MLTSCPDLSPPLFSPFEVKFLIARLSGSGTKYSEVLFSAKEVIAGPLLGEMKLKAQCQVRDR